MEKIYRSCEWFWWSLIVWIGWSGCGQAVVHMWWKLNIPRLSEACAYNVV